MQVPRFWRMKTQRYRLTGVRDNQGNIEFMNRPVLDEVIEADIQEVEHEEKPKQPAA